LSSRRDGDSVGTVNAQATATRRIEAHAWLDVACPWCWIAKRRFEAATGEYGGDVVAEYHSFELAPDLPADYLSSEADFLQFRYPGRTRTEVEHMMRLVKGTGARLRLAYDFDQVQHTSSFWRTSCCTTPRPAAGWCRCSTCSSRRSSSGAATCATSTN
jgi:DSBA-like thioredoxin domain-containing protein